MPMSHDISGRSFFGWEFRKQQGLQHEDLFVYCTGDPYFLLWTSFLVVIALENNSSKVTITQKALMLSAARCDVLA